MRTMIAAVLATVVASAAGAKIIIGPLKPEVLEPTCEFCPATVAIPEGDTVMGSNAGQDAEAPVIRQRIAGFEMATSEITVGAFRRFERETGRRTPRGCWVWTEAGKMRNQAEAFYAAPGYPVELDSPAACLNWEDASAYVDWLNGMDPVGGWRLPSEAEFEYAARAGSGAEYYWEGGVAAICAQVNGADSSSRFRWKNPDCSDGAEAPVPSGRFPPNAYGLGEIIGNLWEWTADCWSPTHAGAAADGTARTSGNCASRVLRGGSWDDPVSNLRSAYRVGIPLSRRQANVGFRPVRDIR